MCEIWQYFKWTFILLKDTKPEISQLVYGGKNVSLHRKYNKTQKIFHYFRSK